MTDIKEIVNNLCLIIRFYTGSDKTKFNNILKNLNESEVENIIFVMDRSLNIEGEFNSDELELINYIEEIFKEKKREGKVDITLLKSNEHVNGTGLFNTAFNYIRSDSKYKTYLFHFGDDDDVYNVQALNNLIHLIKNKKIENLNKNKKIENNEITYKNKYKMTRRESEIIKNFDDKKDFDFYNDDLIFIGNESDNHLLKGVHNSDCNIWSFLFNPYYYDQLTCRLLLFGREDLDMINYLMLCENDTIITNRKRNKTKNTNNYNLKLSNKL